MVEFRRGVYMVLLSVWILAMLSCQSKGPEANGHADKAATSSSGDAASRGWPGDYPRSAGLKGLPNVTLMVYVDQTVPSYPGASGPFADEIKNRILQELRQAGITLANQNEAESALSVSMYVSCQTKGAACGYHTTLELRQWAALKRDPRLTVAAITWRNGYTNSINRNEFRCCLADLLTVDALSLTKSFIQDYRTANPG